MLRHPQIIAAEAVLELTASERDDSLAWLVSMLEQSPARVALHHVADEWRASEIGEIVGIAARAARHLDGLERRRAVWRHPDQFVDDPHIPALLAFALRRSGRVPGIARARRLEIIARRLRRIHQAECRRRQLQAFLNEPARPVDPDWLRRFLQPHR